jgi:16S rRNA (cytosine967-C5)-methyltransferase
VYAAVSQSVELTRAIGYARAAGLVNGVLQSLRREPERARVPTLAEDPIRRLTGWGSHPLWLVERWVTRLGVGAAEALIEANDRRPELFLRPIGVSAEEALRRLADRGVRAEAVPGAPDALRLVEGSIADALGALPAIVQDPAAGMVARFTGPLGGACVADLCAAPGGKAIGLAAGFGGVQPSFVAALDVSPARVRRLAENARRLGDLPLGIAVADALRPAIRPVDVVLLDAPCTGTGTLRRHPDGKWRIGPEDLRALAALQRELLGAAATIVKPGGMLVYATCSLEPEENEEQVDRFLTAHAGFVLEPGSLDSDLMDGEGRLKIEPHRTGWDGAFAARLRRVA